MRLAPLRTPVDQTLRLEQGAWKGWAGHPAVTVNVRTEHRKKVALLG